MGSGFRGRTGFDVIVKVTMRDPVDRIRVKADHAITGENNDDTVVSLDDYRESGVEVDSPATEVRPAA